MLLKFRISDFVLVSDFDIRISSFWARPSALRHRIDIVQDRHGIRRWRRFSPQQTGRSTPCRSRSLPRRLDLPAQALIFSLSPDVARSARSAEFVSTSSHASPDTCAQDRFPYALKTP